TEKTLLSKFKVQFKTPKISTNFFKPKSNPTITKNIVKAFDTIEPKETKQTLSNSLTIDDDDIIMSNSNTNQEPLNINQDTKNPISEPNLNQTSATLPLTTS
ncbi:7753_t:CDS:1, partial [Cetraspora pellucida]